MILLHVKIKYHIKYIALLLDFYLILLYLKHILVYGETILLQIIVGVNLELTTLTL